MSDFIIISLLFVLVVFAIKSSKINNCEHCQFKKVCKKNDRH